MREHTWGSDQNPDWQKCTHCGCTRTPNGSRQIYFTADGNWSGFMGTMAPPCRTVAELEAELERWRVKCRRLGLKLAWNHLTTLIQSMLLGIARDDQFKRARARKLRVEALKDKEQSNVRL